MNTRPARTFNPFALIQLNPDKWQGLVGKEADGFLVFQNNIFGVRAGVINLVNQMTLKNRRTLNEIIPIYAPLGHGSNDPQKYIQFLSNFMKVKPDEILSLDDIYELGKGIITLERGAMVNINDYNEGFKLGMSKFSRFSPQMIAETLKKKEVKIGALGLVAISIISYLIIKP